MTLTDDSGAAPARPGTAADLSRRMDRMEENHDTLVANVNVLQATISRVELNQQHAEELNKLRTDATTLSLVSLESKLGAFMARIDSLMTGETTTSSTREILSRYEAFRQDVESRLPARDEVTQYRLWRERVESRLDEADVLATQVKLLGRVALLLLSGTVVSTVAALYAAWVK